MGFLLLCDVTNEQSFANLRSWMSQLATHAYCETPDIVLCANKVDLENQVVKMADIKEFAEKNGLTLFETSAATGQNIEQAVECLLGKVMQRIENTVDKTVLHPGGRGTTVVAEEERPESNCSC